MKLKKHIIMKTKICTKCGVKKELSDYFNNKNNKKDGTSCYCKICSKELSNKYRLDNIERLKKRDIEVSNIYRANNKESISKFQKKYYKRNIKHIKKQNYKLYKKYSDGLSEQYIRNTIAVNFNRPLKNKLKGLYSLIPDYLIQLKRIQLKIYRELHK